MTFNSHIIIVYCFLSGAYYYYVTEKGLNYEETLIDVDKYAKDNNISYRFCIAILHLGFMDLLFKINEIAFCSNLLIILAVLFFVCIHVIPKWCFTCKHGTVYI